MNETADRSFRKIGIVGSGRMGESIFYHLHDFDYSLVWVFRNPEARCRAEEKFRKKIDRMYKIGALNEKAYQDKLANTLLTNTLDDLCSSDLIIETIVEDAEVKAALFRQIDETVQKGCLFVSNSSSIKPSLICPDSERKRRFAGMHFFYPVRFNTIVEIIGSEACAPQTIERLIAFAKKIGKEPIVLSEQGAFILNKTFTYVQAQAIKFYKEKILTLKEIDTLIRNHLFTMGVFEFLDHVGLDVIQSAARYYLADMEHKEFLRATLEETQKLVDQGFLGVKSGRGFYVYHKGEGEDVTTDRTPISNAEREEYEKEVINKLMCLYINTAYDFIDKGYCTEEQMDAAASEYKGMEKGPVTLCNHIGVAKVYDLLMSYYRQTGESVFYPSPSLRKKVEQERSHP